ncbi:MAG: hypothetical protein LC790_09130 [Actinobacteria bacterium]|nr:hypothetical protein [Actinomycetota bacterium]
MRLREDALMPEHPRIVNRRQRPIQSVDEWGEHAGPASREHWKDGRSAKELANAWIGGDGPDALIALLNTRPETANLRIEEAVAEAQVGFDSYPGGKRNHDLLIRGQTAGGAIIIGLESKADETFGETIKSYASKSAAKRASQKPTNAPERLKGLFEDIAGSSLTEKQAFGDLRYQLFSAVAGTLAAAAADDMAVFIVHEFVTHLTTPRKRVANKQALADFVEAITATAVPDEDAWLVGPFRVPADRWSAIPLWIGHLTTPGKPT